MRGHRADAVRPRRPGAWTATLVVVTGLLGVLLVVPGRSEGAWSSTTAGTSSFTAGVFDSVSSYPTLVRAAGPIAYWRLDETSGTLAADAMTPAYPGTYTGSPTRGLPGALPTQTRTSVGFSGSQVVTVADTGSTFDLPGRAAYSVELWIRPDSYVMPWSTTERLVAKQDWMFVTLGWSVSLHRVLLDAGLTLEIERQSLTVSTSQEVPIGVWSHVAVTYDGTDICVYLNGVRSGCATSTASQADTSVPLTIGALESGSDGFHGRIDEVAVYGRALTAAEVLAHATATG